MNNFFHTKSFKCLMILLFLIFSLVLYTGAAGPGALGDLVNSIVTPMQKAVTALSGHVGQSVETSTKSRQELEQEIAKLQKDNSELRSKLTDYNAAVQEREQYRKFLGLKQDNPDFQLLAAKVLARDPAEMYGNFTLDQGSKQGVSKNCPVVTDAGLVGRVSEVYPNSCRVSTILDPQTKLSVRDVSTQETGVLMSDLKTADSGRVTMGYLRKGTKVAAGHQIVTSGLAVQSNYGGIYPSGLLVGTVKVVRTSPYDVSWQAEVEPFVNPKSVKDVMVITNFEGRKEAQDAQQGSSSAASGVAKK